VSQITKYLASIGKRGGEAGKGKAKRRSPEQYKAMAAKSAKVRKAKRDDQCDACGGSSFTATPDGPEDCRACNGTGRASDEATGAT
jgi:hypothetical protein